MNTKLLTIISSVWIVLFVVIGALSICSGIENKNVFNLIVGTFLIVTSFVIVVMIKKRIDCKSED